MIFPLFKLFKDFHMKKTVRGLREPNDDFHVEIVINLNIAWFYITILSRESIFRNSAGTIALYHRKT